MIHINEVVIEKMCNDSLQSYPNECCGFLFGKEDGEHRMISSIRIVNNLSDEDRRRRFSISAADYIQAEKHADENNLSLLGIYHSHPNHPAIPSETDRVAALPFFSYIIISVMNNRISIVNSWRLNEQNQFEEEQIKKIN